MPSTLDSFAFGERPDALLSMAVRTRFALASYQSNGGDARRARVREYLALVSDVALESGLEPLARVLLRCDELLSNEAGLTLAHCRAIDIALRDLADRRPELRVAPCLLDDESSSPEPTVIEATSSLAGGEPPASPLEMVLLATEHIRVSAPPPAPESDIRELAPKALPEDADDDPLLAILAGTEALWSGAESNLDADTDIDDALPVAPAWSIAPPTAAPPPIAPAPLRVVAEPLEPLPEATSTSAPTPAQSSVAQPVPSLTPPPPPAPALPAPRLVLLTPPPPVPVATAEPVARKAVFVSTSCAQDASLALEAAPFVSVAPAVAGPVVPVGALAIPAPPERAVEREGVAESRTSRALPPLMHLVLVALLGLFLGLFARMVVMTASLSAAPLGPPALVSSPATAP